MHGGLGSSHFRCDHGPGKPRRPQGDLARCYTVLDSLGGVAGGPLRVCFKESGRRGPGIPLSATGVRACTSWEKKGAKTRCPSSSLPLRPKQRSCSLPLWVPGFHFVSHRAAPRPSGLPLEDKPFASMERLTAPLWRVRTLCTVASKSRLLLQGVRV